MALSYSPEYASGAAGLDHSHYGGVPPGAGPPGLGGPRPVKRRGTANRKERRRTQSINSAFAELRECIPNVPADTKLSKIKTLRLATSYIAYLMDLLAKDDQNGEAEAFKAEIKKTDVKEEKRKKELVSTGARGGEGARGSCDRCLGLPSKVKKLHTSFFGCAVLQFVFTRLWWGWFPAKGGKMGGCQRPEEKGLDTRSEFLVLP
ncbi:Heart- and neural crest derivatives-expressed protein 2 [Lemmus lemmus]